MRADPVRGLRPWWWRWLARLRLVHSPSLEALGHCPRCRRRAASDPTAVPWDGRQSDPAVIVAAMHVPRLEPLRAYWAEHRERHGCQCGSQFG